MGPMPLRPTVVYLALVALAATTCASGSGSAATVGVPATNATTAPLLPVDAVELPDVDLATFRQLLSQLRGTPVVVNVWASWCGPCRHEAPHLADAAETYGDRVQFLGIDILDSRGSARGFIREFGWTYPSLFDATGTVRDGLGLLGQPDTVFFDQRGHELARVTGPIAPEELTKRLEQLTAG
jgi:cytochrome c biogenesis protein CcmG/thiol:disulfide interchange protein DsbE